MPLAKLLEFSRFLTAFGKVERVYYVPGTDKRENDMEHSFALALTAWYLADANQIDLNLERLLMYALAHDLVETYAGDTYIYSKDQEHLASKGDREHAAAERIRNEFPEFKQLHEAIQKYELKEDRESRFVYALDKVLPLFQIYEDGGRSWKEHGVTLEMLVGHKQEKVKADAEIEKYFDEMIDLLRLNEQTLFEKE